MNTLAKIATIAAVTLLFGCATAAQRQLQSMAVNNREALQESQACVAAIYNLPDLEPLRKNLPLNVDSASLEQLSNLNYISDVEVQLITANYPKLQTCRQNTITRLAQTTPTWAPIFAKLFVTNDSNLVELVQKKLRWGEFLQRLREASVAAKSELSTENQRILAGLEASHEAEVARRQAALQAFSQSMQGIGQAMQSYAQSVRRNQPVHCTTMGIRPGFSTTDCY